MRITPNTIPDAGEVYCRETLPGKYIAGRRCRGSIGSMLVVLVTALLLSGCLRSSLMITKSAGGQVTLDDTLMVSMLYLTLYQPDPKNIPPETAIEGTIYQRLGAGDVNAEPVVAENYLGMLVHATLTSSDGFAPSHKDLYRNKPSKDDTLAPLPLLRFAKSGNKDVVVVTPDGMRSFARSWYIDLQSESDLAQFRGFSTMFVQGSRMRVAYADASDGSGGVETVADVNVAQFMEYLRFNDELTRRVATMANMTDQELYDFTASFPQDVVNIPSLQSNAAKDVPIRTIAPVPPPTPEELREHQMSRLDRTATDIYPWMHKDIPDELRQLMPLSAGPKLDQDPFRFGQPVDTLVMLCAENGIPTTQTQIENGRRISIDIPQRWHRQYHFTEIDGRGLVEASEIAWFKEEPLFRIKGQREEITRMFDAQSTKYTVEIDTERELRIVYTDRFEGRMVYHQVIEHTDGEVEKRWALITTKSLVMAVR